MQCGFDISKPLQILSKVAKSDSGQPLGLTESFNYMSGVQSPAGNLRLLPSSANNNTFVIASPLNPVMYYYNKDGFYLGQTPDISKAANYAIECADSVYFRQTNYNISGAYRPEMLYLCVEKNGYQMWTLSIKNAVYQGQSWVKPPGSQFYFANPPPGPTYGCVESVCQVMPGGPFSTNNCDNTCAGQPPTYPGGADPYTDGPDAGPIQQYAVPGQPSAFKWVRGVGCIAAVPGADMSTHDWNNPAKFFIIPDEVCAAYSESVNRSMPAYIDTTGKLIPYRNQSIPGTSPQEIYSYSVPSLRWVCEPSTFQCSQKTSPVGYDTQSQCQAACTKYSCNGKACVADRNGPFASQSECEASGCGKWACVAGKFGQCEQVAKGKFNTKSECEGAAECWGYVCDFPPNEGLVKCVQTYGGTKTLAECKASGCGKWGCTSKPGVCKQNTKGTFDTEAACEAPTSICRNTTNDNQCIMLSNGKCDVVNKAYNKATCVPYKKGCYSTTAPQCTRDTDCHMRYDDPEGPYYSDTGGAYWCQYLNVPGSGDVDMSCANPAYQCTADSDCSCSTIPLTGVCYTPCKNKKFDKTGGINAASAKCEWQGVFGSPQCKCSRPPPH